jgi:hypothetical protein
MYSLATLMSFFSTRAIVPSTTFGPTIRGDDAYGCQILQCADGACTGSLHDGVSPCSTSTLGASSFCQNVNSTEFLECASDTYKECESEAGYAVIPEPL